MTPNCRRTLSAACKKRRLLYFIYIDIFKYIYLLTRHFFPANRIPLNWEFLMCNLILIDIKTMIRLYSTVKWT